MARYIDCETACAEVDKGDLLVGNNAEFAKEIINRTPTVDVAPKREVAREIFEEIGRVVCHEYNMAQVNAYNYHIYGDNDEMVGWEKVSYLQGIKRIINLLKDIEKKYTEETMKIKIKLDEGAFAPESAHTADAGYDLRTPIDFRVPAGGYAIVDTGVHIQIPEGFVGFLKSKSGLNVKCHLTGEGVIDSGYTGSIVVKLYSHKTAPTSFVETFGTSFSRGDKIIQLVLLPIFKPELEIVDSLEETERGDGGFGSTGR